MTVGEMLSMLSPRQPALEPPGRTDLCYQVQRQDLLMSGSLTEQGEGHSSGNDYHQSPPDPAGQTGSTNTKAGTALDTANNRKMTQAGETCRRGMPWDTLGGWHEETVAQVMKLASAQARQTGKDRSEAIRHLYQKLSVLFTRGNAALLLNRQPSFPSPDIDRVS
jgi:hypothetical protein